MQEYNKHGMDWNENDIYLNKVQLRKKILKNEALSKKLRPACKGQRNWDVRRVTIRGRHFIEE